MTGSTEIGSQIPVAIISAYAIQWFKSLKSIPWINYESQSINRFVAIVVAILTAAGIHWTFVGGTLTVTGLTLAAAYQIVSSIVKQFALQQAAYRTFIAPPISGAIQEEERKKNVVA